VTVGHVHEILSYQETVATVKSHVDALNEAGTPTMLISVSDHETGGLSLGFQLDPAAYPTYAWFPDALVNGTATSAATSMKIYRESRSLTGTRLRSILRNDLGVSDPDEDELEEIMANREIPGALGPLDKALAKLTSRRAQVGWSTHGHSGVDVNLYGYPRTLVAPYLGGSRENTEIGTFIADTMKLDLKQITDSLQINLKAWYSPITDKLNVTAMADRQHSTNDVAHYHGQHRH
jgi:alkaline phosphatase